MVGQHLLVKDIDLLTEMLQILGAHGIFPLLHPCAI